MKLTKQAKKPKPALSKVTKMKGAKKSVKELPVHESKKLAVLESAKDSLKSPEKKKIDGALMRLAKKKLTSSKSLVPKKQKMPDSIEVTKSPDQKKSKRSKLEKQAKLSKKSSKLDVPQLKKSKKRLGKKNISLVELSAGVVKDALNKKPVKKEKKVKSAGSKKTIATKKQKKTSKNVKAPKVDLNRDMLKSSCEASLKLIAEGMKSKAKEDLFFNLGEPIMMQIDTFKVPKTAPRILRCAVPHCLYGSDPDICLIVPDLKRGRKRDHTYANFVEQYEEMLSDKGVTQIKQVIPFTQLRSEYSQFEMKRRLAKMFDVFLCDGRIHGHVIHFLGSVFDKARKVPIPVRAVLHENNEWSIDPKLKEVVKSAVHKTYLKVHPNGNTTSLHVGHSSLTPNQLADNVQAVWQKLSTHFPGGIANIRTAYLKGQRSLPAPFYASLKPLKKVPVVKAPGKKPEPVEGELSTVLGQHVKVMPDGDIIVTDLKTKEDIDFLRVDPNSIPKKAALKRKLKENKKNSKRMKAEPMSDDDDNEPEGNVVDEDINDIDLKDVDAAENAYLAHWSETNSLREIQQEQKGKVKKEKSDKNQKGKKQTKKGAQKDSSKKGAKSVKAVENSPKEKIKIKKSKDKNIKDVSAIQKKVFKVKKQAKGKNEVNNATVQDGKGVLKSGAIKKSKSDKGLKKKGGKA